MKALSFMSLPEQKRVFVVEDEAVVREDIIETLRRQGFVVVGSAANALTALLALGEIETDVVLLDIKLVGRVDGIQAATSIRRRWGLPIVFLTAHSDEPTLKRVRESGAHGYVLKPFSEHELRINIDSAIAKQPCQNELRDQAH